MSVLYTLVASKVKEERELENSEPRNKMRKREGWGKELSTKNTKQEFHQMMVSCQILEARFFLWSQTTLMLISIIFRLEHQHHFSMSSIISTKVD